MKGSTKIFRIFGIDINIHFSWWIIFIILAWSLSTAFFPQFFPGNTTATYWFMGVVASLLLFLSVLLHELSHSLVARIRNIKVESITLFFFGGVAGITDEEMKPSSEFFMAIAGPIFSFLLAGIFFLIHKFNGNLIITAITFYLYQLNLILAIFNLVPGYPLDGGRAFRAILYGYYHDLKKATRIAVTGGKFFAGFLVVLGIFSLISGVTNGIWFIFLGGFLYFIAGASYEQVIVKDVLKRIPLKELINKKIPTLKPSTSFTSIVTKYISKDNNYFLIKNKKFAGIMDTKQLDKLPLDFSLTAKQLAQPISQLKSLKADDTAYAAFKTLAEQRANILPVKYKNKLQGFITKRSLMHRLVWELKFGKFKSLPKLTKKKQKKKKSKIKRKKKITKKKTRK